MVGWISVTHPPCNILTLVDALLLIHPTNILRSHEADDYNDQEVVLKLEEKHAGTSHYKEYQALHYTMRRSFTSDFDF